jgi:hypothetical protein
MVQLLVVSGPFWHEQEAGQNRRKAECGIQREHDLWEAQVL